MLLSSNIAKVKPHDYDLSSLKFYQTWPFVSHNTASLSHVGDVTKGNS